MEGHKDNPSGNKLPTGVDATQVLDAVKKSGYPLQTHVANLLRSDFKLQEEWSYLDPDTSTLRAIDILAENYLYDPETDGEPRVRPKLSVLIECKQSELPYVFFAGSKTRLRTFPVFAGLFKDVISLSTNDSRSTWSLSIVHALSLGKLPFFFDDPTFCMSFSKCVRKGKELELSGSEPFQGLVLPMVKAIQHYKKQEEPPQTARYFDCSMVLGVAVLDAPMILGEVEGQDSQLSLVPWVRIVRHEATQASHKFDRSQSYGIDVVHRDYFSEYMKNRVMPFAKTFATRALKHAKTLAQGKGIATDLEKYGANNVVDRITVE